MGTVENGKTGSADLGGRISAAIRRMMQASIVDEKVLDSCLKEIALALFQTDLQFKLVRDFQTNVKNIVQNDCSAAGYHKDNILQAIFDEVCKILDPGKPSFSLMKKQTSIVMFVGLQGSGKSVACAQFANYYKKKGWCPGIISADTFRASNFDQLMQNTMEATIPLYGSFMQSDPVAENARRGLNCFKRYPSFDLIIIDTSECHTQESSLIEEMRKVSEATKPDLVILVVDSGIGLAAFHQVQSIKQTVKVGAVIMSRANSDEKVGEAVSAIAATKTPIIFFGRGERVEEFQVFDVKPFVSCLIGLEEMLGFKEDVPVDQQPKFLTNYTLRVSHMVMNHCDQEIPLFDHLVENRRRDCSRNLAILNFLKDEELDCRVQNLLNCSFILRIAKRCNSNVREVLYVMEDHKRRVHSFNLMDDTCCPACEFFDQNFPGVIIEKNAAKRKKPMSMEAENDEDERRVILARIEARTGKPITDEDMKRCEKRVKDEIAMLRALYGKPLESKKDVRF